MTKLQLFIEGVQVDLFKDEIVTVNSSVANVQDISKVFSDFSQSFLVPASPRNNAIFQHWYESDVVPTIDQNLRRDAFIEIETMPFRIGKIQMNEAVIKDGQVVSYSLNFFGAITSLKDRFGELTLKELNYSSVAHTYSGTQVYNRVTDGTTAYDVRYPLIASDRQWTFGDASANDITTNAGAVIWNKLFPAIRVAKIFDIIETQFGITFNSSFFSSARWTDLYIRYQNTEKFVFMTDASVVDFSTTTNASIFNLADNYLQIPYEPFAGNHVVYIKSLTTPLTTVYVDVYFDGVFNTTVVAEVAPTGYIEVANTVSGTPRITFKVRSTSAITVTIIIEAVVGINSDTATSVSTVLTSTLNASLLAPELKIYDFVSAIFRAFNLVCVGENETTFTIEPLQDWYTLGTEKDITKYVINSSNVKRLPLYKQIEFKYKESKCYLNKNFLNLFNRSYGDLNYSFNYDGSDFKIDLPFENLQFSEFTGTNLFASFLLDEQSSAYVPEPILLYLGGEETATTFKFFDGSSYLNVTDYALFNSVNTTGFSLCFGNEFNIVTQETEPNSLYNTYYANHLGNLYDLQQRLFSFTAMLPTGVLANLKMNDKIIIKDKRYLINDISSTLNNGEVKMNLIRELVTIAPDCECIKVTYTLVGEEPVTVEVDSAGIDENGFNVYYIPWNPENPEGCTLYKNGSQWDVLDSDLESILESDTECPFGTYTIEEGSIFEAFIVEPCY
jgi:hypothetical protein